MQVLVLFCISVCAVMLEFPRRHFQGRFSKTFLGCNCITMRQCYFGKKLKLESQKLSCVIEWLSQVNLSLRAEINGQQWVPEGRESILKPGWCDV